jgi:hypothetical protein
VNGYRHFSGSMAGIVRAAVLVAAAALASGCTTYDGNRAVVPFFEVFHNPPGRPFPDTAVPPTPSSEGLVQGEPPHPILLPATREVVLRPFFSVETGPDFRRTRVVWPLADAYRLGAERRSWVLPIWYRHVREETPDRWERRWMVFPFFFGGETPVLGKYFAFFPIAGELRAGILAKDEIHFYLFPVYWHSRKGEFHSLHLVFPFYNQVWGGGMDGWRIIPFYGHYTSVTQDGRPRYEHSFVLWPFYISQKNDLHTLHPSRLVFFFPFYGTNENDRTLTRTYLWPFFNTTLDKRNGKKTYFGFLFPYHFSEGQFDLWPLIGFKWKETESALTQEVEGVRHRRRHFVLWPIERYDRQEDKRRLTVRFWLIPFFWRFYDLRKIDGEEAREWKLWPLCGYRFTDGRTTFYLPDVFPFRQERPLERFYGRLYRLYLYVDDADQTGWDFLFSILRYRNLKKEETRTFTFLGGLFEREARPEGARYRFFYLPWRNSR